MKLLAQYGTAALLHLMSKDDQDAFTEIYNRYWQKLFVIAYNRLTDVQSAEDVVHDVFASLWAGRKNIKIEILENYLATAVKYAVFSQIKRKEKERVYQKDNSTLSIYEASAEESLHYKKVLDLMKHEVEKLPEKCRLVFRCRKEEGMPVKQIAKELNISPKTVENQLTKALKHLSLATRSFLNLFL